MGPIAPCPKTGSSGCICEKGELVAERVKRTTPGGALGGPGMPKLGSLGPKGPLPQTLADATLPSTKGPMSTPIVTATNTPSTTQEVKGASLAEGRINPQMIEPASARNVSANLSVAVTPAATAQKSVTSIQKAENPPPTGPSTVSHASRVESGNLAVSTNREAVAKENGAPKGNQPVTQTAEAQKVYTTNTEQKTSAAMPREQKTDQPTATVQQKQEVFHKEVVGRNDSIAISKQELVSAIASRVNDSPAMQPTGGHNSWNLPENAYVIRSSVVAQEVRTGAGATTISEPHNTSWRSSEGGTKMEVSPNESKVSPPVISYYSPALKTVPNYSAKIQPESNVRQHFERLRDVTSESREGMARQQIPSVREAQHRQITGQDAMVTKTGSVGRLESVTAAVSPSSITSVGLRVKDTSPTGSAEKAVHTSVITQRSAATAEVISTKMSKESRIPSPRASAIEHKVAKIPSSRVEEPIKAQIATVRTIEKEKANIKSSARVKSVVLERETKPAPSVITRGIVRESGLGAEPSAASPQIIKKVLSTVNNRAVSAKVVKEDLSDFIAFLMATLRKTKIYKYIEGMFWGRVAEGAQDIKEEEIEEDAENLATDEGTEVTHEGLRPDPDSVVVDTLQRKDRRTEITFDDAA